MIIRKRLSFCLLIISLAPLLALSLPTHQRIQEDADLVLYQTNEAMSMLWVLRPAFPPH